MGQHTYSKAPAERSAVQSPKEQQTSARPSARTVAPGAVELPPPSEGAERLGHHFEKIGVTAERPPPSRVHGRPNHSGLPEQLRAGIEGLSGLSLAGVRVHFNSHQPARFNALAYTQGTDIHVGPGQEEHLPHEAWHVVQQRQGRVKSSLQLKGASVNQEPALEREADVMGHRALRLGMAPPAVSAAPRLAGAPLAPSASSGSSGARGTIQLKMQGSLGDGVQVDEEQYDNDNWEEIKTHMKGEWNKSEASSPSGGHVLTGMVGQWGPARFSESRADVTEDSPSGVYFTGPNNLPGKITNDQHEYFLVTSHQSRKKKSNTKQSSFWPKTWSLDQLKATLDSSFKTNKANVFASKANTSYWYTWQTLGEDNKTVFPKQRFSGSLKKIA